MNFDVGELSFIAPQITVFVFALLVLVHDVVVKPASRTVSLAVSLLGVGVAAVINLLNMQGLAAPQEAFSGMLAVDGFGFFLNFIVLLSAAGALLISHDFLARIDVLVPEFNPLVLFVVFGMMLMGSANDLMLMFIALEVMSIGLYVLCGINRGELSSAESAIKYFIMGAFASAFLLMGIAFVYGSVATTRLSAVAQWFAIEGNSIAGNPLLAVGVALLLVGFGFKVAAAPFHMWSPDVYQGAPTPVTAFMATGVKAAGFAALSRVLLVGLLSQTLEFDTALWVIAAATILVGNIGALVQDDLKRMLAFSSIAHAGYLLMALAGAPAAGLAANPRLGGILFYLLSYTIMTIGAFAVISFYTRDGKEETSIRRLSGLADKHPVVALALAICLFSLAGVPPTMGFVGKFYLFAAAIEGGAIGLAVVGAIGGAIGIYYYLRPIVVMYMHPAEDDAVALHLNPTALGALGFAAVAVILFGLMPGSIIDLARDSLLSLAVWGG